MAKASDFIENPVVDPATLRLPWHDAVWRRVVAQLDADRFPHALLVTGLPGVGKHRFALRLAMRLLCESPRADDACGACRGCVQFAAGTHPDYHLLTVLPEKTQIVIDQVREQLVSALQLSSQYGAWKVAVIVPADRMNRSAFNALLKTLEEPSGRSALILVSAHPARLAATVRSRCQRFPLAPPPPEEADAWLRQRGVKDAPLLRALAGGAPLAAAELADAALLPARPQLLRGLFDLVQGKADAPTVALAWAAMPFAAAVDWLQTVVHDLIRLRQLGPEATLVNADLRRDLQSGGQRLDWRSLHRHLDELMQLRSLVETPVVAQLQWEAVMIAWGERLQSAPMTE